MFRIPGLFTILLFLLALLIVYSVKHFQDQAAVNKGKIPRSHLELIEFRLEDPFFASIYSTPCKLTGRIKNNSSEYTLTYLELEIRVKDCVNNDCDTAGKSEETIYVRVPPGEVRNMDQDILFTKMKKVRGDWSWSYRVLKIGAE